MPVPVERKPAIYRFDPTPGHKVPLLVERASPREVALLFEWPTSEERGAPWTGVEVEERLRMMFAAPSVPSHLRAPGGAPMLAILGAWTSEPAPDGDMMFRLEFRAVEAARKPPIRTVTLAPPDAARYDPEIQASYPTSSADPWVVVGRTTIDGTAEEVARIVGAPDKRTIMKHAGGEEPVHVGGQWIRADGIGRDTRRDSVVLTCEVVRRRSEIDAEQRAQAEAELVAAGLAAMEAVGRPTCPECGPHGNRGLVFLVESAVPCLSCGSAAVRYDDRTIGEFVSRLQEAVAQVPGVSGPPPIRPTLDDGKMVEIRPKRAEALEVRMADHGPGFTIPNFMDERRRRHREIHGLPTFAEVAVEARKIPGVEELVLDPARQRVYMGLDGHANREAAVSRLCQILPATTDIRVALSYGESRGERMAHYAAAIKADLEIDGGPS